MTFQPIPYLDCHICEIELLETASVTSVLTPLNLGSIIVDTGGQISVNANYITFPANTQFFVKANVVGQCVNGSTTITSCDVMFMDASNTIVPYQGTGLAVARTGALSDSWYSSVDCIMMLFSSASPRAYRLSIANVSVAQPIRIPYNNATSYIPNSTITIMYK